MNWISLGETPLTIPRGNVTLQDQKEKFPTLKDSPDQPENIECHPPRLNPWMSLLFLTICRIFLAALPLDKPRICLPNTEQDSKEQEEDSKTESLVKEKQTS